MVLCNLILILSSHPGSWCIYNGPILTVYCFNCTDFLSTVVLLRRRRCSYFFFFRYPASNEIVKFHRKEILFILLRARFRRIIFLLFKLLLYQFKFMSYSHGIFISFCSITFIVNAMFQMYTYIFVAVFPCRFHES